MNGWGHGSAAAKGLGKVGVFSCKKGVRFRADVCLGGGLLSALLLRKMIHGYVLRKCNRMCGHKP